MKLSIASFLFAISLNGVAPVLGDKKSSDLCEECPNGHYFRYVAKPEFAGAPLYGIQVAIEATPPGCALAPIKTEGDVLAASSAILPNVGAQAYVGAYRPSETYFDDCGISTCTEPASGWVNFSGSDVPDNNDIWISDVGGDFKPRLHLMVRNNKLIDALPVDPRADGAVYKCCVPTAAACPLVDDIVEDAIRM